MKKLIICVFALLLLSCNKEQDEVAEETMVFENLGLTADNEYPYFPDLWRYLGDNEWYHHTKGDTLMIYRRDMESDDSGDDLQYRFLKKSSKVLVPLTLTRHGFDMYVIPIRTGIIFVKPITNCRFQAYIENKFLACEIITPNASITGNGPLVDKIWIDLTKVYEP